MTSTPGTKIIQILDDPLKQIFWGDPSIFDVTHLKYLHAEYHAFYPVCNDKTFKTLD